jgi:hypothetical protein
MSTQLKNEAVGLELYDSMVTAIAECHRIDEVKPIRDKARALELYAQQARNLEAERRAAEVRVRAERRAGELLQDMAEHGERDPGKGGDRKSQSQPETVKLSDLGITKTQSSRWQALAAVPKNDFETALKGPNKPTTTGFIPKVVKPIDPKALWLWGRMLDFERDGFLNSEPQSLHDEMSPAMQDDMRRLLPLVAGFLNEYMGVLK